MKLNRLLCLPLLLTTFFMWGCRVLVFDGQTLKPNTSLVVKGVHDLNGGVLTIPKGCVLKFSGGKFKNGTIVGNDTRIIAARSEIFENVSIDGTWVVPEIFVEWMHIPKDEKYDCQTEIHNILKLQNSNVYNTIYLPDRPLWYLPKKSEVEARHLLQVGSNSHLVIPNTIYVLPNDVEYRVVYVANSYDISKGGNTKANNIIVDGGGEIIGDLESHDYTYGTQEGALGVAIYMADDVIIKNIKSNKHPGDGFYIGTHEKIGELNDFSKGCKNILIDSCYAEYNRRQGLSVTTSINNLTIANSNFSFTGKIMKTSPGAGIDFEINNQEKEIIKNVTIRNCSLVGNIYGSQSLLIYTKNIENFIVDNCFFDCVASVDGGYTRYAASSVVNFVTNSQSIQFRECKMKGVIGRIKNCGEYVKVRFDNCDIKGIASYDTNDNATVEPDGEFFFNNCNFEIDRETRTPESYPLFLFYNCVNDVHLKKCIIKNTQAKSTHLFETYGTGTQCMIEAEDCQIDIGTEVSPFTRLTRCNARFGNKRYISQKHHEDMGFIIAPQRTGLEYKNNVIELIFDSNPKDYISIASQQSNGYSGSYNRVAFENNIIKCNYSVLRHPINVEYQSNSKTFFLFDNNTFPYTGEKMLDNSMETQKEIIGFEYSIKHITK